MITAQNAALADEVTAVKILGRRMSSAVLLIEALGGGWDRAGLPQRPECCGKLASSSEPLLDQYNISQANMTEAK